MITQLEFNDLQKMSYQNLSAVSPSALIQTTNSSSSPSPNSLKMVWCPLFVQACERVRQERKDQGINAHLLKTYHSTPSFQNLISPIPLTISTPKAHLCREALLELFAQLTDSPLLAYRTRNNGDFSMMFMPTKIQQHSNAKTDGELYYHNDRTAHPFSQLIRHALQRRKPDFTGYDGKAILII